MLFACLFPALMSPVFFGRRMPFFRASDPRKKRRRRGEGRLDESFVEEHQRENALTASRAAERSTFHCAK